MRRIAASALLATTLFALGACGTSEGSADVSAVGTWGQSGNGHPQLILSDDGSLSGTDG